MDSGGVSQASSTGSSTFSRNLRRSQDFESNLLPLLHSFTFRYPEVLSVISLVIEFMQYLGFALNPMMVGNRLVWGIIYLFQLPFWDGIFTNGAVSYTTFIVLYWVIAGTIVTMLALFLLGLRWTLQVTHVVRTFGLRHLLSLQLSVLFIPTIKMFLASFMCQRAASRSAYSSASNGYVVMFPEANCESTIVRVHEGFSIAFLILWGSLSYVFTMTLIPVDREDASVRRRCNTHVDFALFFYRVGLSISGFVLLADGKYVGQAAVVAVTSFFMSALHCIYLPYYQRWMNSFWAVGFALIGWAGATFLTMDHSMKNSPTRSTILTQQGAMYAILCCGAVCVGAIFYWLSTIRYDRTTEKLFSRLLVEDFVPMAENPFAVAALQRNLDLLPFPHNLPETDAFFSAFHPIATNILEEGLREEEVIRQARESDERAAKGDFDADRETTDAGGEGRVNGRGSFGFSGDQRPSKSMNTTNLDSDAVATSSVVSLLREAHRRQAVSPTINYALLPSDAEVAVRFLDNWQSCTETFPTPHMVCFASRIFHRFMLKYPRNGMLVIAYVSFLCDYAPSLPHMTLCLDLIRRCCLTLPLTLTERYLLYYFSLHVKESMGIRDSMHQSFAKKLRCLHQQALLKNAMVWRCLLEEQRSPMAMFTFTNELAHARWKCCQTYVETLTAISDDAHLMRSMGQFMMDIYHFKSVGRLCDGIAEVVARLQQLRLEKTFQAGIADAADDAASITEVPAGPNRGAGGEKEEDDAAYTGEDDDHGENSSVLNSQLDGASSSGGASSQLSSSIGSSSRLSSLCTSEGRSSQSRVRNSKKMSRQMAERARESIYAAYTELTAHMHWGVLTFSGLASTALLLAAIGAVTGVVLVQLQNWEHMQRTMEDISHSHAFCFAMLTQALQAARLLPYNAAVGLTKEQLAQLQGNITVLRSLIDTTESAHNSIFYGGSRVNSGYMHKAVTSTSQYFWIYTSSVEYRKMEVSFLTHIPMVLATARRVADQLVTVPTRSAFMSSTDMIIFSSNMLSTIEPAYAKVEEDIHTATQAMANMAVIICAVMAAVALVITSGSCFLVLWNYRRAASILTKELMHFYLIPRELVERLAVEAQRQLDNFTYMMSMVSNRLPGANKTGVADLDGVEDPVAGGVGLGGVGRPPPGGAALMMMGTDLEDGPRLSITEEEMLKSFGKPAAGAAGGAPGAGSGVVGVPGMSDEPGQLTALAGSATSPDYAGASAGASASSLNGGAAGVPLHRRLPHITAHTAGGAGGGEADSGLISVTSRFEKSTTGGNLSSGTGMPVAVGAVPGAMNSAARPASVRLLSHLLTRARYDAAHGETAILPPSGGGGLSSIDGMSPKYSSPGLLYILSSPSGDGGAGTGTTDANADPLMHDEHGGDALGRPRGRFPSRESGNGAFASPTRSSAASSVTSGASEASPGDLDKHSDTSSTDSDDLKLLNVFDYHDVVSNGALEEVLHDAAFADSDSETGSVLKLDATAAGGTGDGRTQVRLSSKERKRLRRRQREAKLRRIAAVRENASNIGFMASNYEVAKKILDGENDTTKASTMASAGLSGSGGTTGLRRAAFAVIVTFISCIIGCALLVTGLFAHMNVEEDITTFKSQAKCMREISNAISLTHLVASRYVTGENYVDYVAATQHFAAAQDAVSRCRSSVDGTIFYGAQEALMETVLVAMALIARNKVEESPTPDLTRQTYPLVADYTWTAPVKDNGNILRVTSFLTSEELEAWAPYGNSEADYALNSGDRRNLAITTLLGPFGLALMEGLLAEYKLFIEQTFTSMKVQLQGRLSCYLRMQTGSIICWSVALLTGLAYLYMILFPPTAFSISASVAAAVGATQGGSAPFATGVATSSSGGAGSGGSGGENAAAAARSGGVAGSSGSLLVGDSRSKSARLLVVALLTTFILCTATGIALAGWSIAETASLVSAFDGWLNTAHELMLTPWKWHRVQIYTLAYPFVNYEKIALEVINVTTTLFLQEMDMSVLPQPDTLNPHVYTAAYKVASAARAEYMHYAWLAVVCAMYGRGGTSLFAQFPEIRYVRWDIPSTMADGTINRFKRLYPTDTYLTTFEKDVTANAMTPEVTLALARDFMTATMIQDLARESMNAVISLVNALFAGYTETVTNVEARSKRAESAQVGMLMGATFLVVVLVVTLAALAIRAFSHTVEERIIFRAAFQTRSFHIICYFGFVFVLLLIVCLLCIIFSLKSVELTDVALEVLNIRHSPSVFMARASIMAATSDYPTYQAQRNALSNALDAVPQQYEVAYYGSRAAQDLRSHRSVWLYGPEAPYADYNSLSSIFRSSMCANPTNAVDGNEQPFRIQLDVYHDILRTITKLPTVSTLRHGAVYEHLDDALSRLDTVQYFVYSNTDSALLFMRGERNKYLAVCMALLATAFVCTILIYVLCLRRIESEVKQQSIGAKIMLLGMPPDILNTLPEITEFYDPETGSAGDQMKKRMQQSERLLQNILPLNISRRLKNGERVIADAHKRVTVTFAALVGMEEYSHKLSGTRLVQFMNGLVVAFDHIVDLMDLEKIKLVGDIYFFCGGLTRKTERDHAIRCMEASLFFFQALEDHNSRHGTPNIKLKVGINTGPVVAGVIGNKKVAYDLWGDCVNTASRMYSTGQSGRVQVSDSTHERVNKYFDFEDREVQAKGKGTLHTHLYVDRLKSTPYTDINWRVSQ